MDEGLCIEKEEVSKYLPHRPPMLLLDRMTHVVPNKSARGYRKLHAEEFFFQGHYPGDAVMPGSMIFEAVGQAASCLAVFSKARALGIEDDIIVLLRADKARYRRMVRPGDTLVIDVEILSERMGVYSFAGKAEVEGQKSMEVCLTLKSLSRRA